MNTSGIKWAAAGLVALILLLLVCTPRKGTREDLVNPGATQKGAGTDMEGMAASSQRSNLQSGVWRKPSTAGKEPSVEDLEEVIHLTREQAEAYLAKKGRNGTTLLAAFYGTQERAYLDEAVQKYGTDPKVALVALARSREDPAMSVRLLEQLKQASPSNSLAFYLSAQDRFAKGNAQEALQDLQKASQLTDFDNYGHDRMRGVEEFYASTGLPPGEAKSQAMQAVELSYLSGMKSLVNKVAEVQKGMRDAGESAQADALLQQGFQLAQRLNQPSSGRMLIDNLVGMAAENILLKQMDPDAVLQGISVRVSERQEMLKEQRRQIREELVPAFQSYLKTATDDQRAAYLERVWTEGEQAAMQSIKDSSP